MEVSARGKDEVEKAMRMIDCGLLDLISTRLDTVTPMKDQMIHLFVLARLCSFGKRYEPD